MHVLVTCCCLLALQGGNEPSNGTPNGPDVTPYVKDAVAALPGYRSGDLLTWSDVQPILASIRRDGFPVPEDKDLEPRFLKDNDRMVKMLRGSDGRAFMRKVGGLEEGFDRVDRLRGLPRGYIVLQNLIDGPDGHLMIQYMTDTKEGKNLGRQLSNSPNGEEFNKQTQRIYAEKQLIDELNRYIKGDTAPPADEDKN